MREKEIGGPGFHQFPCEQFSVMGREGRTIKIRKHDIKRKIMLSSIN